MNEKMTLAQKLIAENKRTKNKSLNLGHCGLTELPEELFECVWLEKLSIGWNCDNIGINDEEKRRLNPQFVSNSISKLNGIENLVNLNSLDVSYNHISDLFPLKKLIKLKYLDFNGNQVEDISPLVDLRKLEYLNFWGNKVENLSPLKELKKLTDTDFSSNRIKNFPYFLKNLPRIKGISFFPNPYELEKHEYLSNLFGDESMSEFGSLTGEEGKRLNLFSQIANTVEKQIKEQENYINLKIPKLFERIFSQYILLFKDFVEITKGKIIEFYLRSENDELLLVANGETNISRSEILRYLKEYINLLTQNLKTQPINIENRDMNNQRLAIEYDAFILELQAEITGLNHKIDILKFKNKHLETEIKDKGQQLLYFQETLQLALGKSNDSFNIEKVTKEIIDKLARMQERKSTQKHEDLHNDILTDFLRDKGYYITDQTRSGKAKKQAGELDIMIREINGTPVSIIEAMRLDSCGAKNTKILEHLCKLLFDYGGTGLERNFFIIYAEAKDFESLWTKYQIYMNETVVDDDDFASFQRGGLSPILSLSKPEIKVGRTRYKRFGSDIEVYHLLVNMYVPQKT